MTWLIKRDAAPDLRAIRPFAVSAGPAEPQQSAADREISRLREAIAALESQHQDALAKARLDGRRDGEAAFKRDEAQRVALLQQGVETALGQFQHRLAALQELALLLSDTALNNVFGDPSGYHELIARAVAAQLKGIGKESVLRICLSPQDFRDGNALRSLGQRLALRCEAVIDANLQSGDCRIELRLGQVELSIAEHWAALQTQFRRLAGAAS